MQQDHFREPFFSWVWNFNYLRRTKLKAQSSSVITCSLHYCLSLSLPKRRVKLSYLGSWRVGAVGIQYFERLDIENKVAFNSIRTWIFRAKLRPISGFKKRTNICADEPQVLLHNILEGVPWNCSQFYAVLLPLSTCTSHSCVLFCSCSDWVFWMSVKYNLEFCWFHWGIL